MRKQRTNSISGILLAAGLSTRMGQPKQLLPFGESTIVETVVDSMLNAKFSNVIVVIGHCAEQIQDILGERQVNFIFNSDYNQGMLTSVQTGIRAFCMSNKHLTKEESPNNSDGDDQHGFSLMLVDQPFITSSLIDIVIDVYLQSNKGIVLPSYDLRRGHPVIFHHRYAETILKLNDDSGGVRSLYNTFNDDIHYVQVDTDVVLRDIDYPDDYKRAINEDQIV